MSLRRLLLLRGAFNVVFAIYLLISPATGELYGVSSGGYYALGDGLLALCVAFVLGRNSDGRWLFAPALVDALVRLALGAMIVANPNMRASILIGAVFSTTVIVTFIALGIFGMVVVALGRKSTDLASTKPQTGVWPAFVISAEALLFGLGLIVGIPGIDDRRALVGAYAFLIGLTLVLSGIRRTEDRR